MKGYVNMRNNFFKPALIFTILLIVSGFLFSKLVFLSFEDPVDMYEDENFDIIAHGEGGRIKTEIYASLGSCVSETTTTTKNGQTTSSSTDYYYVVPAFDKAGETYYIVIEVDQDDRSVFNRITNETWNYLEGTIDYLGETVTSFEGTINELDDELYDYMLEWFREMDLYENETELRAHVLPLCLTTMNFSNAPVYIVIFLVLLALTVLFWVLYFKRRSKLKAINASSSMAMNNGLYVPGLDGAPMASNIPTANADPYNTQYNANTYNNDYNKAYDNSYANTNTNTYNPNSNTEENNN